MLPQPLSDVHSANGMAQKEVWMVGDSGLEPLASAV